MIATRRGTIKLSQAEDIALQLAKKSSAWFGHWTTNGQYEVPRHIDHIFDIIDPMVDAGGARIILCAPPRHGKSEGVNVKLPARFIWRKPERRVILAGHTASFAATFGAKTRDLICENYGKLGVNIKGGLDAAMDEWFTKQRGGMRCAGVGVGIVGLGADLFIIDDPTPDSKAAWSPAHHKELIDWYTGVVDRRLEPNASVLVSMQRWPGNDFVSWLTSMRDRGKENWHIINLCALYDAEEAALGPDPLGRDPFANGGKGSALWPERWDEDSLIKKKIGSEDISYWYAQYQQRPPDKSSEGLAYHKFHPQLNVRDVKYNPKLPILWACDFNVDPMTSVIAQSYQDTEIVITDHILSSSKETVLNKTINVLDEIYLRNSNTQESCAKFIAWVNERVPDNARIYVTVYGDASGTSRKTTGKTDYRVIREELVQEWGNRIVLKFVIPAKNPTQRDRVTKVNRALFDAAGMRHLFLTPKCVETRQDFLFMKWHRDGHGNPTNDLDDSNMTRGHISDALGYLVNREYDITAPKGEKSERLL